jgi:hypothetical protein
VALDIRVQLLQAAAHLLGSGLAQALFLDEEVDAQVFLGDVLEVEDGEGADAGQDEVL